MSSLLWRGNPVNTLLYIYVPIVSFHILEMQQYTRYTQISQAHV
jgi:hypothetical protein